MADLALTYTYEILTTDTKTSVVEVLYKSDDPLDDDVIVYLQIGDPTNQKAVISTVMLKAPIPYWVRIRQMRTAGVIREPSVITKDDVAITSLSGLTANAVVMVGPGGPEAVSDLFTRNKLRTDLATANTGKL